MKKTVNFCGNCPFLVVDYDDFAVGNSTLEYCNLARHLNLEDSYISSYDGFRDEDKSTIQEKVSSPEWCPIKKEEYTFDFREFSNKRLNEIEIVENELEKLEKFFEMEEHEVDEDDEEFNSNTEKYKELSTKLGQLYSSEELSFEDDFKDQLKKSIDQIKDQLTILENAGIDLQNAFNNLSNEEN